jgi:hypothetical protein
VKGGGNIGSIAILEMKPKDYRKRFSIRCGIIFVNKEDESSRQGLVLASISQTLNESSIIKSRPNSSAQNSLFIGSIFENTALIVSVAMSLILG